MLTIGIETWTSNLHVNQGGKLTLQTDWNRTLLKAGCLRKSSLWIVPVPARLTCKNSLFERRAQNLVESHMRKLNFAKKAVQKALSWQFMQEVFELPSSILQTFCETNSWQQFVYQEKWEAVCKQLVLNLEITRFKRCNSWTASIIFLLCISFTLRN